MGTAKPEHVLIKNEWVRLNLASNLVNLKSNEPYMPLNQLSLQEQMRL